MVLTLALFLLEVGTAAATGPAKGCLWSLAGSKGGLPAWYAANGTEPTVAGPYTVKVDLIKKVPGLSTGGAPNAYIYYPSDALEAEVSFPFLSFAHGTGVGGPFPAVDVSYGALLNLVASQGFIIMAPTTCQSRECFDFVKDQLATIAAAKAHPELHPALKSADFSQVGVFGHSMGGVSTISSAAASGYGIKAAASMHPCWQPALHGVKVNVPILFTAGSADVICEDGCAYNQYKQVPNSNVKVFFDVAGTSHFEPTLPKKGSEVEAIALFFACHLRQEQCEKVNGNAICAQVTKGQKMYSCEVGPSPLAPFLAV